MKFRRRTLGIILVMVMVIAIGVVVFLQLTANSTASVGPSVAVVEPPAPSYIGNSSIYLLSANASYGKYYGTLCFIINVTVRNDYTPQQPPPNNPTQENNGYAWFILIAKEYDKNSTQINAQEFIPPDSHPNYNQQGLSSGETLSFNIYMTTTQQHDVDHYELEFGWLGAFPAP